MEGSTSSTRTVERSGQVYNMHTADIGKRDISPPHVPNAVDEPADEQGDAAKARPSPAVAAARRVWTEGVQLRS